MGFIVGPSGEELDLAELGAIEPAPESHEWVTTQRFPRCLRCDCADKMHSSIVKGKGKCNFCRTCQGYMPPPAASKK